MNLLLLALIIYCVGAITMLLPKKIELMAHYIAQACAIVASGLVLYKAAFYLLMPSEELLLDTGWGVYTLQADSWSAAFLCLTGLAGIVISIYAIDYAKAFLGKRLRILGGLWNVFLLSMVGVLLAGDAFTFLLTWELMAVSSFLLVNHESEKKETWSAAFQYLVMTHLGTAAIMIGFFIIASGADSLTFADLARSKISPVMQNIAFVAAFMGFALKAGLVPLHVWLPNAHPAAPTHVSALMSGVMLKIAVYGFGRFVFQFFNGFVEWQGILVLVIGLISAFLSVLYAIMEKDMKRILAYSSVENMGIIFSAIGTGMILMSIGYGRLAMVAFTGALVHSFNHSIMKALMFMASGAVMHATGSKNIEKMGGLIKYMPWTACFTLIGSMALAALPLTNGFVGEWLTLQGFATLATRADGHLLRLLAAAAFLLFGLTGALALGCFVRLYGTAFLGKSRSNIVEKAHEMPFFMLLGMGIETVLVVVLGFIPGPLVETLQGVISGGRFNTTMADNFGIIWGGTGSYAIFSPILLGSSLIVIFLVIYLAYKIGGSFVYQDVTWNCGTYPTERQQYTATGFSKPLRRAFSFLLKPKREAIYLRKENAYFGKQVQYKLAVPDQFTERLYAPFQKHLVMTASVLRKIQQGSVRLYIGYAMVALIIVLVWGAM